MLDQRSATKHVEYLQSAANAEYRHIRGQRFLQQSISRLSLASSTSSLPAFCLPVTLRVDVASAAEQQAIQRIQ